MSVKFEKFTEIADQFSFSTALSVQKYIDEIKEEVSNNRQNQTFLAILTESFLRTFLAHPLLGWNKTKEEVDTIVSTLFSEGYFRLEEGKYLKMECGMIKLYVLPELVADSGKLGSLI